MKFSDIHSSVLAQWAVPAGQMIVPFIMSEPGLGKSACARKIAQDFLTGLGLPYVQYDTSKPETLETATVVEFTASLREPVDLNGLPMSENSDFTQWKPPAEFYALKAGTGVKVLILEEASDAPTPMQNALCRVIYDKHAGNLQLTDQLYIIATGNRTSDKSGANRITSKFAGRTRLINFTASVDDFADYGMESGRILPMVIQYLRWKNESLVAFDPNRHANANPRSWERVSLIPENLSPTVYLEHVVGEVGEGVGNEFVGFKRIWDQLPDLNEIEKHPEKASVPKDPATLYAVTGALARRVTDKNFEKLAAYFDRLPKEFNVMAVKDSIKLCPAVKNTKAFVTWATKNTEVLM